MGRIILNQECYYHAPDSMDFFNPEGKEDFEIRTVNLGEFNNNFLRGVSVNKRTLEKCIESISADLDKKIVAGKLEYSGVSLTPFIFLAAQRFKIKNIQFYDISLWHNFRNLGLGIDSQGWRLLNNDESIATPQLIKKCVNDKSAHNDEVTITFSTSFPISEKDLVGMNPQIFKHYYFKSETIQDVDVDNVFCRSQAEAYANEIHKFLSENPNYKKINLAIASSVAMTFCLAYKLLNENYSKEITVYHYDPQQNPCRPWGITFCNNNECKAVVISKY